MNEFLKILTLILISSVKFAFGPSFAYLNENYDFTWFETNLYAIIGGMIGVTIFIHLSDWLIGLWDKGRNYFYRYTRKRNPIFSEPVADVDDPVKINYEYVENAVPKRRIFSRRTRRMVRIWKKYGLMGLAALTPVIFSIPIGTFFMARLEKNRKKIYFYMFISITCWSLMITTFFQLTHVRTWDEVLK